MCLAAGSGVAEPGMISTSFGNTDVTKGEVYDDSSWGSLAIITGSGVVTNIYTDIGGTTLDAVVVSDARGQLGTPWENFANKIFVGASADSNAVATITLSEIPYARYMVVVYLGGDASNVGYVSDGSATYYYYLDDNVAATGTQTLTTDTVNNAPGWNEKASYAAFGSESVPLTGNSLTLTVGHPSGMAAAVYTKRVGIGGIQLIDLNSKKLSLVVLGITQ